MSKPNLKQIKKLIETLAFECFWQGVRAIRDDYIHYHDDEKVIKNTEKELIKTIKAYGGE